MERKHKLNVLKHKLTNYHHVSACKTLLQEPSNDTGSCKTKKEDNVGAACPQRVPVNLFLIEGGQT